MSPRLLGSVRAGAPDFYFQLPAVEMRHRAVGAINAIPF